MTGPVPALVVHTAVVYVASRVAGISTALTVAVPVAAVATLGALVVSTVLRPGPARHLVSR